MKVFVYVSPAAAIVAGKGQSGVLPIEVDESFLALLSQTEREALAAMRGLGALPREASGLIGSGDAVWRSYPLGGELKLAEATQSALLAWLREAVAAWQANEARRVVIAIERAAHEKAEAVSKATAWLKEWSTATDAELLAMPDYGTDAFLSSRRRDLLGDELFEQTESLAQHWLGLCMARDVETLRQAKEQRQIEVAAALALPNTLPEGRNLTDYYGKVILAAAYDEPEFIAELKRRAAALEVTKKDALATAVNQWATIDQRARYAEGYMPTHEVLAMVRNQVFGGADGFERRMRLTEKELQHGEACEDSRVTTGIDAFDATELTDGQFAMLNSLRKALPDAYIRPRVFSLNCASCDAVAETVGAHALLYWHGWILTREYNLGA